MLKYSPNQRLAKDFIGWYMAKEQYGKWFEVCETFIVAPTKLWYGHPVWTKDPKLTMFRDVMNEARPIGYAGPPGRKASESMAKYVVVDMFAKAIQGVAPEDALRWARGELEKVHSA